LAVNCLTAIVTGNAQAAEKFIRGTKMVEEYWYIIAIGASWFMGAVLAYGLGFATGKRTGWDRACARFQNDYAALQGKVNHMQADFDKAMHEVAEEEKMEIRFERVL
jgi:hypothetical protein